MARKPWMFIGDNIAGIALEMRPGVTIDCESRPDEKTWRYTPCERFREVLSERSLYFTRLSTYLKEDGDNFEGASPALVPDAMEKYWAKHDLLEEYRAEEAKYGPLKLQTVLVNCWHKREYEADGMWARYGRQEPAIAVVSCLERLIDSMPEHVTVGHVEYVDFATEPFFHAGIFARAFMKRRLFEDEREVRAVLQDDDLIRTGWGVEVGSNGFLVPVKIDRHPAFIALLIGTSSNGFLVPVKIDRLIESVVVGSLDLMEPVMKELAAAGLTVPVRLSERIGRPRY